ncbi:MAG: ACP S-malonyltransferase [Hyphomicrobiales bacterium]|nr:ACP S-malonyltransferase [Hyphomicrobiales bacterium]
MSNLLVFPGQGSQFIGMGEDFAKNFKVSKNVFEEVNESLSLNLSKIMWEGEIDELTRTENAQPALMSVSVAILRAIESEVGIDYEKVLFMAGHSLGEYSALVAANSFKLDVAARLLKIRGQAMQRAVPEGQGAMAALIGVNIEQAENLTSEVNLMLPNLICDVANDNAPGQVVISGSASAVNKAIELAPSFGARKALKLPVSAPFHCSLMTQAADEMRDALIDAKIQDPITPIISNVTATSEVSKDRIIKLLIEQVTGRVRWAETIRYAKENNVEKIYEIGAGKILTGLVKRIDETLNSIAIDDPNQIDKFQLD